MARSKRRNKATPTVSQRALRGFQFGYIFTYGSRLPFNVLLGSDRNLDTNNNDRPVGVGRNTGRGFDFASLDLRVSRKVSILRSASICSCWRKGFNVLNRANFGVPNNTFGSGRDTVADVWTTDGSIRSASISIWNEVEFLTTDDTDMNARFVAFC